MLYGNRIRDHGHYGMTLASFTHHPNAMELKLTEAEVTVIRLYTGMFVYVYMYNNIIYVCI